MRETQGNLTPPIILWLHGFCCSFLDKAAIIAEGDFASNTSTPTNPWKLCSVTRVEEVKMMANLLPVWATTIVFWTTYAQMITFSVEQASTMERSIGGFQIPAGSLTVFFVAAILITLAVYDRLIMPLWKRSSGKPGINYVLRSIFVDSFCLGGSFFLLYQFFNFFRFYSLEEFKNCNRID